MHLGPGESVLVSFTLNSTALALVAPSGDRSLFPGTYGVLLTTGNDLPGTTLTATVTVDTGAPLLLEAFKRFW